MDRLNFKLTIAAPSIVLLVVLGATMGPAQSQEATWYPDPSDYDPAIPTLEQVVGHAPGDRITSPEEVGRYLQALAQATPRVQVYEYARTWEDRPLWYAVVASEENMSRIEEIRSDNVALADPNATSEAEADAIIASNPVVMWLAYGVHGNEISSTDAALLTIYHLVAARADSLASSVLASSVVVVDPMQNPDGRNRFVNHYRQAVGRWPNASSASVEQNEAWPGGRTNHYLFDLNRDWFVQTQPESRGKVAAFMHWRPQVYVDLHEMGGNSSYYFPPQAAPLNPHMAADTHKWTQVISDNNARWFDRLGFDYFNNEVFDSFYPGYGASWPTYQGAMGMTYEQASSRGLLYQRNDDTVLAYRETVRHHFIASLSTAEATANNRAEILRDFYDFGREAIDEGAADEMREVIIDPARDPGRAAKLVQLLMTQGVEVSRSAASFSNVVVGYHGGDPAPRDFPAGTYRISLAQPAKRLVKVLLAPETPMDEGFMAEQRRRYTRRLGDQIYDISGWSLPLLFDLDAYIASEPSSNADTLAADRLAPADDASSTDLAAGGVHGDTASVAYLLPWGTQSTLRALAMMHRHDIRVHSADDEFAIGGRDYPAGSLIVKVAGNPDDLHEQLVRIASHSGADIYPANSSRVTSGVNFGSGRVRYLPKPRVALAYDVPTSAYSAGWARYLLEAAYEVPMTIVRTSQLAGLAARELEKFNVIILPDAGGFSGGGGGGYGSSFGETSLDRLKAWLRAGGTLVTIGGATRWATDEEVGLLATKRRRKTNDLENEDAVGQADSERPADPGLPDGVYAEEEEPTALPGAVLRAQVDGEHWLGFGYSDRVNLIAQSRNFYDPLTLDEGLNVATYLPAEELLVSGVAWEPELELIAGTPFLMVQSHGQGNVVAFTEDPNFRAYFDGLNLLFLNGVLLGPGH